MFALSVADKYIQTGVYSNAIVIGAETLSKIVDWSDRTTCVLFGDGAGGAYVEKSEKEGIIKEEIGSKGEIYEILTQGYTPCANAFNDNESGVDPLSRQPSDLNCNTGSSQGIQPASQSCGFEACQPL